MFDFSAKFYKDQAHCNFETKTAQVFNFRSRSTISNITFTINEPDLLWVPLFHSIRNIFQFWNHIFLQWRDWSLCFNVECVLLGRNCDFLGSCLVVTAFYLVVTAGYCLLPGGYWWLLLITARYCSFPLLVWTWQNTYPKLKTTCHIKLKLFLWTKLLENLLHLWTLKFFMNVINFVIHCSWLKH